MPHQWCDVHRHIAREHVVEHQDHQNLSASAGAVGIFQGKYPHKLGGRLVTLRVCSTAETICENLLKVSSSSSVPEQWLQSRNISWLITVWFRERRLIELILCKRSCWIIRTIHTWRNWRMHEWKSLDCSKWTDFTIADFSLPGTWSLSMLWKREFTRHRFMNWIILIARRCWHTSFTDTQPPVGIGLANWI